MVNRVSPVRKLPFFCFAMLVLLPPRIRIPDVLGVSLSESSWRCLPGAGGSRVAFRL